jgi:uncharacterized protein (DUF1800 family)
MKYRCLIGRLTHAWKLSGLAFLLALSGCQDASQPDSAAPSSMENAYRAARLSDEQAADILLQRFTFGARPGEREKILQQGLPAWFAAQLDAVADETTLEARLAGFDALTLTDAELFQRFPSSSMLSAHARRFYAGTLPGRDEPVMDFSIIQAKLDMFSREHGFHSLEANFLPQLYGQKLMRSVYAENQLREVMTDFWQNHFFTGTTHFGSRPWVMSHERDVLRPHALGRYSDLLRLSYQHPALLNYFSREAQPQQVADADTTMGRLLAAQPALAEQPLQDVTQLLTQVEQEQDLLLTREFWPPTGPNLELAQSLLRRHSLGLVAALSQQDIDAAARLLTGWSTRPYGPDAQWFAVDLSKLMSLGFVSRGSFWFRADQHDALAKTVLGKTFPAGGGVEEAEQLLVLLARHPDTARHISAKLVQFFVGENADAALTKKLSARFIESDGDVPALLAALVSEPAFWQAAAQQPKFKTPFQFAVSALRSAQADITSTTALVDWAAQLGQPLYQYQEATGYSLEGSDWLDPGALITRARFAQALQAGAIDGVHIATASEAVPALALRIAAPAFQLH